MDACVTGGALPRCWTSAPDLGSRLEPRISARTCSSQARSAGDAYSVAGAPCRATLLGCAVGTGRAAEARCAVSWRGIAFVPRKRSRNCTETSDVVHAHSTQSTSTARRGDPRATNARFAPLAGAMQISPCGAVCRVLRREPWRMPSMPPSRRRVARSSERRSIAKAKGCCPYHRQYCVSSYAGE